MSKFKYYSKCISNIFELNTTNTVRVLKWGKINLFVHVDNCLAQLGISCQVFVYQTLKAIRV